MPSCKAQVHFSQLLKFITPSAARPHVKFKKTPALNMPFVVGPDYPNLLGPSKSVNTGRGFNLLGKAHPIQPIPRAGRFEQTFFSRPKRLISLGADSKGVAK